jgi:hypothetical protein
MVASLYIHDGVLYAYGDVNGGFLRLLSKSGTRQGDPFGPLLFAIAIRPALLRVQSKWAARGVIILAYLDDIYVLGPPNEVKSAMADLRNELLLLNLECNPSKCWAWSPSGAYGDLLLPHDDTFCFTQCDCPKILGVFVGPDAAKLLKDKACDVSKPNSLARKLMAIRAFAHAGHHAYALLLLLNCAAPSVNYMLRACRPADVADVASESDRMLIEALADICGLEPASLHPGTAANTQLRMRQSQGGVGLHSMEILAKSAYLASWAAAAPLIARRWPHLAEDIAALAQNEHPHDYGNDIAAQRRYCLDQLELEPILRDLSFAPASDLEQAAVHAWQHRFATAEAERAETLLDAYVAKATLSADDATQLMAWRNSLKSDGRSAFLHAAPTRWYKPLNSDELEFAVRRLLRLPLQALGGTKCSCGAIIDQHAEHADICPHQIGERHNRHTHVNKKAVEAPAAQVKLSPQTEAPGLIEDTNGRPADTGIAHGHGFGDNIVACYDVVGCGTCAPSYVEQSARYAGGVWEKAAAKKLRNARRLHGAKELLIIPLAFETQGALHPNWRVTYESWARRWATMGEGRTRARQGMLVRGWIANASVAIQRAQFHLVYRMRANAKAYAHGAMPHDWRTPDADDVDAQCVAWPSLEGCVLTAR